MCHDNTCLCNNILQVGGMYCTKTIIAYKYFLDWDQQYLCTLLHVTQVWCTQLSTPNPQNIKSPQIWTCHSYISWDYIPPLHCLWYLLWATPYTRKSTLKTSWMILWAHTLSNPQYIALEAYIVGHNILIFDEK